eukprot:3939216-Rhodomonas_salina.1
MRFQRMICLSSDPVTQPQHRLSNSKHTANYPKLCPTPPHLPWPQLFFLYRDRRLWRAVSERVVTRGPEPVMHRYCGDHSGNATHVTRLRWRCTAFTSSPSASAPRVSCRVGCITRKNPPPSG